MERDFNVRRKDSSYGPVSPQPGSNDEQQGEKREKEQAGIPDKRLKRVANMLYECIPDGTFCQHRFSFGYKYYCAWLLNYHSSDPNGIPPCLDTGKEHKHAD